MWWWAAIGCVEQVLTRNGQLVVEAPDMSTLGVFSTTAPVLVGTTTCPTVDCAANCPTANDALACFTVESSGALALEADCWKFDTVGEGAVLWREQPCAANAEGYAPTNDRLGFDVVAPSEVLAVVVEVEWLAPLFLDPGPEPAFPADWAHAGGTRRIVAGSAFSLFSALFDGLGREVGWEIARGWAEAEPLTGVLPTVAQNAGTVTVTLEEGAAAELWFGVGDERWPLAEVAGVPASTIESLEVVVAYVVDPAIGSSPTVARAIARDAQGALVFGAPVTWSLDAGELAIGDPMVLPGPDYVAVIDACVRPSNNGGPHTATLRATLGALTDPVELAWTVVEGLPNAGWSPSPFCVVGEPWVPEPPTETTPPTEPQPEPEPEVPAETDPEVRIGGGCGCGGGLPSAGAWLVAGLVVARRRGRRG